MANHPYKNEISDCLDMLRQARAYVDQLLSHADLTNIKISVDAQLVRAANTLSGLIGGEQAATNAIPTNFEPLKSMFGQEIGLRKPVELEMLQPTKTEQELFIERRDDLYDRFLSLDNDTILKVLNEPNGEPIIRTIAKKAGIEDYRDAVINTEFIDDIKAGIEDKIQVDDAMKLAHTENEIISGNDFDEDDYEEEDDEEEDTDTEPNEDDTEEENSTPPSEPEKKTDNPGKENIGKKRNPKKS